MLKRQLRILVILTAFPIWAAGQNLVPNSGFELMRGAPKGLGEIDRLEEWTSPNAGTPDLFSKRSRDPQLSGVPANFFGAQPPYEGSNYAGILLGKSETEYLQVTLREPLVQGRVYFLRARVSTPSDKSDALDQLTFRLLPQPARQRTWDHLPDTGAIVPAKLAERSHESGWYAIQAGYQAKGGEQQLLIGYRSDCPRPAYTWIDLVELTECPPGMDCLHGRFDRVADLDSANFIPNGSFEEHYQCPRRREDLSFAKNWRVSLNSPDFFHTCGEGSAAVPDNTLGEQWPRSGEGYGGFWATSNVIKDYYEYLSIQLKRPLRAGLEYELVIWVSLAEISSEALPQMHVRLDKKQPILSLDTLAQPGLLVEMRGIHAVTNFLGWVPLKARFTAKGGEDFVTIGNFSESREGTLPVQARKKENNLGGCYYYVDDVRLSQVSPEGAPVAAAPTATAPPASHPTTAAATAPTPDWQPGDTLVLQHFLFDHDRSALRPEAIPLLDTLTRFMRQNPQFSIYICGHTDASGTATYNYRLSLDRANAVRAQLTSMGIPAARLKAGAAGETQPRFPNTTPEGRQANRRVEILFWKDP